MEIVESLKSVSAVSSKLLNAAKTVSADPSAPNAKNNLTAAARQVSCVGCGGLGLSTGQSSVSQRDDKILCLFASFF